ncbi:MAG TPA: DNA polymerase ligase N-terminal domain-containing protein, partial [Myxococcales bacterium]|nr:DNA polymerase ligase N-terminal domain-containing protein [Myxococcales bacterium]
MARKRLPEYEAKRDFGITKEPAPGDARGGEAPSFVVHKHDATALHYDVRLEMDQALASWAVPKGPSYDTAVKRLAIQTEDHPLEYGSFEGRIADGEYGGGDSLIWDNGTCDSVPPGELSQQRKKGHIVVAFAGKKLQGQWHLVRTHRSNPGKPGKKPQWLMFKAKDGTERTGYDVVAERPESVVSGRKITRGPERKGKLSQPRAAPDAILKSYFPLMLATLTDEPPAGEWHAEVKYDGYRALAALSNGRLAMQTRNELDLIQRFPRVAKALQQLVVGDAVIDGEICALDADGIPRFELLQQHNVVVLFAFDLLRLDGEDLRERPLEERRDLLSSLLSNAPPELRLAEVVEGPLPEALEKVRKRGLEGLLLKAPKSTYAKGRSRDWLKLKVQQAQELAILGWTPGKGAAASGIGALLLGAATKDGYAFAGKVGTGFSS